MACHSSPTMLPGNRSNLSARTPRRSQRPGPLLLAIGLAAIHAKLVDKMQTSRERQGDDAERLATGGIDPVGQHRGRISDSSFHAARGQRPLAFDEERLAADLARHIRAVPKARLKTGSPELRCDDKLEETVAGVVTIGIFVGRQDGAIKNTAERPTDAVFAVLTDEVSDVPELRRLGQSDHAQRVPSTCRMWLVLLHGSSRRIRRGRTRSGSMSPGGRGQRRGSAP